MGIRISGNLVPCKAMTSFRQFVNVTSLDICLSYFGEFRFPQKCKVTIRYSAAWWCNVIRKLFLVTCVQEYLLMCLQRHVAYDSFPQPLRCQTNFRSVVIAMSMFCKPTNFSRKNSQREYLHQFFSISNFCAGEWLNPGVFYKEHILINNQIRRTFHWRKRL